jgi:hypothetical protein
MLAVAVPGPTLSYPGMEHLASSVAKDLHGVLLGFVQTILCSRSSYRPTSMEYSTPPPSSSQTGYHIESQIPVQLCLSSSIVRATARCCSTTTAAGWSSPPARQRRRIVTPEETGVVDVIARRSRYRTRASERQPFVRVDALAPPDAALPSTYATQQKSVDPRGLPEAQVPVQPRSVPAPPFRATQ